MILTATLGLTSCKKNGEDGEETTVSTTLADDGGASEDDSELYKDLPNADYKGYEFNILVSESNYAITTMVPTEEEKDSLSMAMFNRNSFVKDSLKINIVETSLPYPAFTKVQDEMRKLNNSNTYIYDVAINEAGFQTPLAQEGIYFALDDYEAYLDLDKPWWFTDAMETLKIDGRTCELFGDLHLMYYDSIHALAFNQNQFRDNKIEFPYDDVRAGTWMLEDLKTIVATINDNQDKENYYGIVGPKDFSTGFMTACGFSMVEQDEDEILRFYDNDELIVDIYEDLLDFYASNGDGMNNWIHPDFGSEAYKSGAFAIEREANAASGIFSSGRGAIYYTSIGDIHQSLRKAEFDYGIIPLPKYSTDQPQYINFNYSGAASCGLPVTSPDLERTCTVLEWLSAYSYKLVKPEYYDIVVQTRAVRDNDSIEMLDIIFGHDERGTVKFELDLVYQIGIADCVRKNLSDNSTSLKSDLDSTKRGTAKSNINKVLEAYKG